MQRDQARTDRNRTILIVVASIVVGLAIIAYPAIRLIQDSRTKNQADHRARRGRRRRPPATQPTNDEAGGTQDHKPDGTVIHYPVSPPSSGPHYAAWAPFEKKFYTLDDRPPVANLVHNLEHGYTILWYNEATSPKDQIDADREDLQGQAAGQLERQVHRRAVQRVRRQALAGRQEHRLLPLERQRPGPGQRLRPPPVLRLRQRRRPQAVHGQVPVRRRPGTRRRLTPPAPERTEARPGHCAAVAFRAAIPSVAGRWAGSRVPAWSDVAFGVV